MAEFTWSGGEEADRQRADPAADEVHADHVERVVVAELVLQADRQRADRTGDEAEDHGRDRGDEATGRGDGDQTGDGAGRGADQGRLAVPDPLHDDPAEHAGGRGDLGVEERDRRGAVDGQLRTGVEAEPAEPQQAGAERDERHVVRLEALLRPADPLAEDQHQAERGRTGVDVHRRTTGEVRARGSWRR